MNGILWGFFLYSFFFIVFLLSLVRCLGVVGSSAFGKRREGNKKLLCVSLCSSYNSLLTALCPVHPLFWAHLHHMKCFHAAVFLLLPILLSLLSLPAATDDIVLHLIEEVAISSDSSILPFHTIYVLTLLPLPGKKFLFQKYLRNFHWTFFTNTTLGCCLKFFFP